MRFFFFCKQKTAYEMRISDWSSDVCSSDLPGELAADTAIDDRDGAPRKPALQFRSQPAGIGQIHRGGTGPLGRGGSDRHDVEIPAVAKRSEERRGGKECVRTC